MSMISIIVPVFNVEKYLRRCIESMLVQTNQDFELILVDDGSADCSGAICDEYAAKDSRVKVIHQKNYGQSVARNNALDWIYHKSNSEWIVFVDSDDYVHPRMLEILYGAVKNDKADIAVSDCCDVFDTSSDFPPIGTFDITYATGKNYLEFYFDEEKQFRCWTLWGKIFHRRLFQTTRLPVGRIHEDNATVYKLIYQSKMVADCPVELYYYYQNHTSTMHRPTPEHRWDWLLASQEMFHFFLDKDSAYLLERSAKMYMDSAYPRLKQIKSNKNDGRDDLAFLWKSRKDFLIILRKCYGGINKYAPFFNVAFPKSSWCYWTIRGIRSKILHMLRLGYHR